MTIEAGIAVTIKDDAFSGLVQFNGKKGRIAAKNKGSEEPARGLNGETIAIDFTTGGRVYCTEDQFTID